MATSELKQNNSADSIRLAYLGSAANTRLTLPEVNKHQKDGLTSSAKHIIREAKKRLGEQATQQSHSTFTEDELLVLVETIEQNQQEHLTDRERTAVIASLSAALEHYDILTPLINNPEVNDIICSAYNDISIQANRANIQTDLSFPDHESYKSFVENILKRAGKSCTTATPVVDAAIDPHIRACVTHESFSPPKMGPMLTLRISRHQEVSLEKLMQYELAPRIILDYISTLVGIGKATLLIAGEVGSGKTTLVKALTQQIKTEEALLIIEDTHEISVKRKFIRTLLTREANTEGAGRISPAQAIRTGMRMAMNRIILGEMRDAEAAEAFIDVCASGHAGMSTIHARSARDALSRLELFLARAQGNVSTETIRMQIANAVSLVIYLDIDPKSQRRRIFEIIEVGRSGDGVVQISPMFTYQPTADLPTWRREAGISAHQTLLTQNNVYLPDSQQLLFIDPEQLYRTHVQYNF